MRLPTSDDRQRLLASAGFAGRGETSSQKSVCVVLANPPDWFIKLDRRHAPALQVCLALEPVVFRPFSLRLAAGLQLFPQHKGYI